MKLENQVVSLELAEKLKELGVKQESYFYWKLSGTKFILVDKFYIFDKNLHGDDRVYSAFTVAELGEILPDNFLSGKLLDHNGWTGEYACWFDNKDVYSVNIYPNYSCKTEANARAKMLIYLIKNKLI